MFMVLYITEPSYKCMFHFYRASAIKISQCFTFKFVFQFRDIFRFLSHGMNVECILFNFLRKT